VGGSKSLVTGTFVRGALLEEVLEKKTAPRLVIVGRNGIGGRGWSRQTQWVQHDWEDQEVLGPVEGNQTH
jgi:hypothetical protein